MGAFDPVASSRTKPRTKPLAHRQPKTLADKIPYFIGGDTTSTWPADTSERYKEYLRASLAKKHTG